MIITGIHLIRVTLLGSYTCDDCTVMHLRIGVAGIPRVLAGLQRDRLLVQLDRIRIK
jgi:hypothetical protein